MQKSRSLVVYYNKQPLKCRRDVGSIYSAIVNQGRDLVVTNRASCCRLVRALPTPNTVCTEDLKRLRSAVSPRLACGRKVWKSLWIMARSCVFVHMCLWSSPRWGQGSAAVGRSLLASRCGRWLERRLTVLWRFWLICNISSAWSV